MIKKIVKLSSASCSPCKQYEPIFNSFKSELESLGWAIEILDVTEDRGGAYAQKYGVRGVPATLIIEEGKDPIVKMGVVNSVSDLLDS
ncbi:MAG TPA: thioredoxin [Candidatus Thioglobus sp.]|jgi:thiol-disulfide isomerase/thioredoxin|nr:thioredoxin [Candidatus Thioglobus sp.]HIB30349.1 thioredoxin [Candidatus Thioglobus sp.]HIB96950.1 thioredoxin [Candidatus Thioglobus sp.]